MTVKFNKISQLLRYQLKLNVAHADTSAAITVNKTNAKAALDAINKPVGQGAQFVRIIYLRGNFYVDNRAAGYQFTPVAGTADLDNNNPNKKIDLANYTFNGVNTPFNDASEYTHMKSSPDEDEVQLPADNGRFWDITPAGYNTLVNGKLVDNDVDATPYHYSHRNAGGQHFHPVIDEEMTVMANHIGSNQRWWMFASLAFLSTPLSEALKDNADAPAAISMSTLFPLFLCAFSAVGYYFAQKKRYRELYQQEPSEAVCARFKEDAFAMFFKMSMMMTGTIVGLVLMENNAILNSVLQPFFKGLLEVFGTSAATATGPAAHLAGMVAVGLTTGLFLVTATILSQVALDLKRGGNVRSSLANIDWKQMAKVFIFGSLAGMAFFAINVIPGGQKLFGHVFDKGLKELANTVGCSLLTGFAVSTALKMADKNSRNAWEDFKDANKTLKPTAPVIESVRERFTDQPPLPGCRTV